MEKERLEQILNNIMAWGMDHNDEFIEALVYASDMTLEEAKELEVECYHEDYEGSCLPKEFTLSIDSCLADAIEDTDYVENYIEEYMADEWGHCVIHYSWSVEKGMIHVTNIEWDVD